MYKVFLVDDEPSVTEGLKIMIPWKDFDFELCGEASNARDALEKIEELRPHLVITDIRMPQKNGLELIQEIRKLGLAVEFIILSGFSEFSYAQQAIRSQVFHYLLKPLDKDEFSAVLLKVKNRLDQLFLTEYGFTQDEVNIFKKKERSSETAKDDISDENPGAWWKPLRENFDEELTQAIKLMNPQDARKLLNELFSFFKTRNIAIEEAHVMVNSCIYHILRIAYERNIRLNNILLVNGNRRLSLIALKKNITDILEKTISLMREDRRKNSRSYLYNVKEHIDSNFDKELTVANLAEREFLDAGYLGEAFIRQFGCSINEYQHRLRIEKAIDLINNSQMKLSDIATVVGYNNYNNFFTHFEKIIHKKPTDLQRGQVPL
ncbi:MAG: response regulator [Ruminiclostridium sp.]|nr:response regulator [Ruminiclostridium sp.]